ncbi:MAG: exo-alpha-sialidase [Phycisphaerales bacterium]|nr:MAG: exo-alpha-sialidase [Phycisphaerales bacterium]
MTLKKTYRRKFRSMAAMVMIFLSSLTFVKPVSQKALSAEGARGYKGDATDIRVVRRVESHPDAWRLWQPFIAQWKRKHLVVAFGAMTNGKKDMGDIFASISKDDGDTWSESVAIFDHNRRQGAIQFAYANPVLFKPADQDVLWCFAMRCPILYKNSEDSQLASAFSADGGYSWTSVELAMHYAGPLILNAGIQPAEIRGRPCFLLPAHRNSLQKDPLGSRDHFVLSSTSLLEWKLEAFIPQPEGGRIFLHEGNIAPWGSPGELKIVMRTANYDDTSLTTDPPRAYSSLSRDGGRTWTPAQPESALHNAKSKGFFGRTENGTHIYVYNDGPAQRDIAPGFPHGGRTSLRYKIRPAGGTWSEEKTFFDAGIKNSYPTLIEVAPGDFRAVWDSGTSDKPRTHIHFGKLRITP